jgi:chemotaxis protein methyltransferase CheR
VLQTAARGVYKLESMKNVSTAQLQKYFLKGKGNSTGLARVKPELQKHVEFFTLNLIEEGWPLKEQFDIVFCRNVMIYFDAATQRQILARIHRVMKPQGTLFVGHSENFSDARTLFTLRGKTVYEKV